MRKKLIAAVVCALMTVICNVPCSAFDENNIYTDYKFYRAKVYVCDTDNSEIVLKNVTAVNRMDGLLGARDIEYRALGVNSSALFEKDGNKLSLEVINGYLLDREALVLVGRCGYGYKVLYLEI